MTKVTRLAFFAGCLVAGAITATLITNRAGAQSSVSPLPVFVAIAPMPKDLVHVDARSGSLTSGQQSAVYTVPAGRDLVITNAYLRDDPASLTGFNLGYEEVSLIDAVTNRVLLAGASFLPSPLGSGGRFLIEAAGVYAPANGLLIPAGTQLAILYQRNLARTWNAFPVMLQFSFDGYLSR